MNTISFKELLDGGVSGVGSILIPMIQRSYAQGRDDVHATRTRDRFLKSIHAALSAGRGLTLDFIYGHVKDRQLVPLDGQQRLTTLFLLHWYAAKKEGICTDLLDKFSYATRYSSRDFCQRLATYTPCFEKAPSEEIRNEGWFPLDWRNDATVNSMLTMLDAIHSRSSDMEGLWKRLDEIKFYFLSVDDMRLTDEIYIKMNSRGKPLTAFEHFKAELIKALQTFDESAAKRVGRLIDTEWTDMLWPYKGDDNVIDDEFLRYFHFVCDLLTYLRYNETVIQLDEFDLIDKLFRGDDAADNLSFFEQAMNCWTAKALRESFGCCKSIDTLFDDYISESHNAGKCVTPFKSVINLFEDCLRNYGMRSRFSLGKVTVLYAFVVYLNNVDTVCDADFRRRLRMLTNLVKNSPNEIVDNPKGDAGNRMPAILRQTENLILHGELSGNIIINGEERRPNFNAVQLDEERAKAVFCAANPDYCEPLFELEDHPLLTGRVEIVGFENTKFYERFRQLFDCDWDRVDCALMACGDYTQRVNRWYVNAGTKNRACDEAWRILFHRGEMNKDFANTVYAMHRLLSRPGEITDEWLRTMSDDYLAQCEHEHLFDWRYYYIKYPSFRRGRFGRLTKEAAAPYELVSLFTRQKESENARQCFLWEIGPYNTSVSLREKEYAGGWLSCLNGAFVLTDDDGLETGRLDIPQTSDGVDVVDRLAYFHEHEAELTSKSGKGV